VPWIASVRAASTLVLGTAHPMSLAELVGPTWAGTLLRWWLPLALTPILLLGWPAIAARGGLRRPYGWLLAATAAGFALLCVVKAALNSVSPPEWDIAAFWTFAKVAAAGANFYEPTAFHALAPALARQHPDITGDPLFVADVLDVGFPYPPPTMLFIAPLGWLDLQAAALVWQALTLLSLAALIVLLWNTFLRDEGWLGLAFVAAFVLTLRATYATVALGQTNFIALVLFLLFWRNEARPVGGLYLALAIAVKPLLAVLLAYLALRRSWRSLAVAVGTAAGLILAAVAVFGSAPLLSYLRDNPVLRLPLWIYSDNENQSLAAGMVRLLGYDLELGAPTAQPLYIAVASTVALLTFWLSWRSRQPPLALTLMVAAALLLYPQSWQHYTVFLIPALLLFWCERARTGLGTVLTVAFISAVFACVRYEDGTLALVASLLSWIVLAVTMLRTAPATAPAPA
jgi:hypothetical protein